MWIYSLGVTLRETIPNIAEDGEAELGDFVTHSDVVYSKSKQREIAERETINDKRNGKNCNHECCIKEKATTNAFVSNVSNPSNSYINMNDGRRKNAAVADTNTSILTSLNQTIFSMCDPNINYRASLMYLLNVSTYIRYANIFMYIHKHNIYSYIFSIR